MSGASLVRTPNRWLIIKQCLSGEHIMLKRGVSSSSVTASRKRTKRCSSESSDAGGDSDDSSSWAPSDEESNEGGDRIEPAAAPVYLTRSRGRAQPLVQTSDEIDVAMDRADAVVNNESDLSSDTSSDESCEEEDEYDEEEEEEDESSDVDDEYSDDDSFVTSEDEESRGEEEGTSPLSATCIMTTDDYVPPGEPEADPVAILTGEVEEAEANAPAPLIRCNGGIDSLCDGDGSP